MDKYIGRLLDNRYEILEVIGTGGMAVVYKARCHRLNRLVAIKILKDDFMEDEDFRRRFQSESQAVAMLSHPNIVSVYDVSNSVTADYIVMELIEGITLKQYMEKRKTLNWKETLHFAIQIAKALEHAHSRGIVHRDIKPHNIMVLKNGSVKVTDFGIARMKSKGNTLTKEALGSVHYISPEQAKGGRVDDRSDIYSLGVVMYEMMAGRPPYDGESPVAVAIQHINGGAIMPSILNPNIPGGLEQIIMKAMGHEPADRFASATAMLADLDEFRKDPSMLFDYVTPPTDEVTRLSAVSKAAPVVNPAPRTTAEKVASRNGAPVRRTPEKPPVRTQQSRPQTRAEQSSANRRQPEKKQKKSRATMIAIIICSCVMLIALLMVMVFIPACTGASLFGNDRSTYYEVPQFVGKYYDTLPVYTQFVLKVDKVYDEEAKEGQIIDQQPEAGRQIEEGNTIFLTVSKGKAPVDTKTLLNLVGMSKNDAINHLNSLSLNLVIDEETTFSEEYETGKIVATKPAEGALLQAGQTVTLVVSMGPEIREGFMPDVTDKTEALAIQTLENQNLDLVITPDYENSSTVEEGYVIRTEPAAGSELKTGQAVKIYVSKGPEMVTMPNVVGRTLEDAKLELKRYGFENLPEVEYVEDEKPEGTVLSQYPTKYIDVEINTDIRLVVSSGPKETEPPTTAPPAEVTMVVTFHLGDAYVPAGGETEFDLELRKAGETEGLMIPMKVGETSVDVKVTGAGKVVYELWIGGSKYGEQEVKFSE